MKIKNMIYSVGESVIAFYFAIGFFTTCVLAIKTDNWWLSLVVLGIATLMEIVHELVNSIFKEIKSYANRKAEN